MNIDRYRLLVADDREEVATCIKDMLCPMYEVDVATSGSEVIYACSEVQYFGLLIDVSFEEGMSGVEAAAIVRSLDKEIRIIVFSGRESSDSIRRQIIEIGAQYMEKPLMLEHVRRNLGHFDDEKH